MSTTSPRSTSRPGTSSTRTRLDRRDAAARLPGYGGPEPGGRGRQVGEDLPARHTDNLGGFNAGGPDRVLQEFTANPNGLIYSSPVYFDGKVYIQGVGDVIKAFALKLDPATNTMMLNETPVSEGTTVSGFPGEVQSVSADGTSNGIVWSAEVDQSATGGPAILHAYDANDLSTPLYTSNQAGPRDTAGGAIKFTTPTIANGHVYLGAQMRLTSTDSSRRRAAARPPRCRVTRASRSGPRPPPYSPGSGVSSPPPHPPARPRRESRGPPSHRGAELRPARRGRGPTPRDPIRQRANHLARPGHLPVGRRQRARVPPGPQEESVQASLLDLRSDADFPIAAGGTGELAIVELYSFTTYMQTTSKSRRSS